MASNRGTSGRARRAKPTSVVLVRHGATPTTGSVLPGRAPGLHLSDKGRDQAAAAAQRIATLEPVAVYASPLERAVETATPITRGSGMRVRRAAGLVECDFGEWTGRRLSELRKLPEWRTVLTSPSSFRFPGGESFAEMQQRIWDQLERLADAHRGETVVAVSHADPIKAAVAMASGVHLDLFQRLVISTASVSVLSLGSGPPMVHTVNSTGDDLSELALR